MGVSFLGGRESGCLPLNHRTGGTLNRHPHGSRKLANSRRPKLRALSTFSQGDSEKLFRTCPQTGAPPRKETAYGMDPFWHQLWR